MSQTPEERREAEITHTEYLMRQAVNTGLHSIRDVAMFVVDGLDTWRRENRDEPAVADAIRYGVTAYNCEGYIGGVGTTYDEHLGVNYPEGLPSDEQSK